MPGPATQVKLVSAIDAPVGAKKRYWDRYYRATAAACSPAQLLPSQFAVFVCSEFSDARCILDLGCGNGRDSFFFAHYGIRTVGVDESEGALELCRSRLADSRTANLEFHQGSVADPGFSETLKPWLAGTQERPAVAYGRFFLHAISETEEAAFLAASAALLRGQNASLALEFRTLRDAAQAKVTAEHYRRFVDPASFIGRAHAAGFRVAYYAEGFGYAKHKADDAHVARCLLSAPA
jgi:SAM-dependent methyltransferase